MLHRSIGYKSKITSKQETKCQNKCSVSKETWIHVDEDASETVEVLLCACMCVCVCRGRGVYGGKIEGTTYIVTLLAHSMIEFSGLAVAASLGVIPVVPGGGRVGGRRQQRAGHLWPIRPVLRVLSGKEDSNATE